MGPRHARRRHRRRGRAEGGHRRSAGRHGARRAYRQPEGARAPTARARRATPSPPSTGRSRMQGQYGIRIINLSIGMAPTQGWRDDPLCQAVERAVRAGIVVVASAGNYGQTADGKLVLGSVTSPGISPLAITVGALRTKGTVDTSDDYVAPWSSKGPTRDRPPDQARPGRAGQQDRLAAGAGVHAGEAVSGARGAGQRAERLFPAQRHEPGGGSRERRGGAAAAVAAAAASRCRSRCCCRPALISCRKRG